MNEAPISREQAYAAARLILDTARARRDALPIRAAAQAAATPDRSADEIELTLRRLHARAGSTPPARIAA
ncbi:hypothetical protein SAMN05216371_3832 [Streptomyces sp. TLI_053]|uniref:hypothetical protein n=1 Tax=Streptomyces sp. TLI_053 TaxID=1855352 RepID=UPI00087AF139|nr:hypothetical protein [Streptomyces sp. TLI_053]SDT69596.1 hypothetical protein SAMN05216371_3832 [Streptomyces sp. TLI_053]